MTIHETAFLTCAYRSSDPELSGDHYAYLYNNARTDDWVDAITAEVSDKEPFLHCLRNRFFLDKITDFFGQHPEGVLVNWGSGFSMYPFLIAKTVQCIDIDQNDIISYKSDLLNDWIKKGKIPKRNVEYIKADFRQNDLSTLIKSLKSIIDARPCFFILEGVLYFLSPAVTEMVFIAMKEIQKTGDLLGCVSFLPDAADTAVLKNLNAFFDKNNFTDDTFSHQLLPHEFYTKRDGYVLKDHQDYCSLSQEYKPEMAIYDQFSILNENMYILKRK